MSAMDEYVARLNIEHFKRKLESETDAATCETLKRLLAEEEAKLATLLASKTEEERGNG